jgi:predicted methyltransferase
MHGYALEWLAEHLHPGRKVLDVGCGSGYLTACFASMVHGDGGEPAKPSPVHAPTLSDRHAFSCDED